MFFSSLFFLFILNNVVKQTFGYTTYADYYTPVEEYVEYHSIPTVVPVRRYKSYYTTYPVYYGTRLLTKSNTTKDDKSSLERRLSKSPRYISQWRNFSKGVPLSIELPSSPYVNASQPLKTFARTVHYITNSSSVVQEYLKELPQDVEEQKFIRKGKETASHPFISSKGGPKGTMLRIKDTPGVFSGKGSSSDGYTVIRVEDNSDQTSVPVAHAPSSAASSSSDFTLESASVSQKKPSHLHQGVEEVYVVTEKEGEPKTKISSSSDSGETVSSADFLPYHARSEGSQFAVKQDKDSSEKGTQEVVLEEVDSVDDSEPSEQSTSESTEHSHSYAPDVQSSTKRIGKLHRRGGKQYILVKEPPEVEKTPAKTGMDDQAAHFIEITAPKDSVKVGDEGTTDSESSDDHDDDETSAERKKSLETKSLTSTESGSDISKSSRSSPDQSATTSDTASTLEKFVGYIAHPFMKREKETASTSTIPSNSVPQSEKTQFSQLPLHIPQDGDFIFYGIVFDSDTSSTLQHVKLTAEPDGKVRVGLREGDFVTEPFVLSEGSPLTTVWSKQGDEARLLTITQGTQQGFFLQVDKYKLGIVDKRFLVYHS